MTSLQELNCRKDIWRTAVICPNCREDNAPTFRFCGMCGTPLEPRRPSGAPVLSPLSTASPLTVSGSPAPARVANTPDSPRPLVMENPSNSASKQVPSISGPSMLGLDEPGVNQHHPQPPTMDSLRETAFSGLDSFFEPEPPTTGGRRILLLVILLAALGGAGWWIYTNFLGIAESRRPAAVISSTEEGSTEPAVTPATPAAKDAPPAPDAGSSQAAAPSAGAPQSRPGSASADPDTGRKPMDAAAQPVTPAGPAPTSAAPAVPKAAPDKSPVKPEPGVHPAKAPTPAQPVAADTGDAAFRKGEAYLYGRGERENCEEAVKYLKAASAKSNAKARSAFGTMYATGHCVPRDLPTSYLWFALALRTDPNNQILEKDLSAVWNQMTPPERQMATRMKQ